MKKKNINQTDEKIRCKNRKNDWKLILKMDETRLCIAVDSARFMNDRAKEERVRRSRNGRREERRGRRGRRGRGQKM